MPDRPENYAIFAFGLVPVDEGSLLTVTVSASPTEASFRHLDFYWRGIVGVLKRFVEGRAAGAAAGSRAR